MDILNDYYPIYSENQETSSLSESDVEETKKHIDLYNRISKKKRLSFDDFCTMYSDDIWYIWCIIKDYSQTSGIFDKLDYPKLCEMCYENSTK
jgi:hypothetical protein